MLVRVKAKEKVAGVRLEPGAVMEVPDRFVPDLVARGVVEVIERQRFTSAGNTKAWVLEKRV